MFARFASTCPICAGRIKAHAEITRTAQGYAHANCAAHEVSNADGYSRRRLARVESPDAAYVQAQEDAYWDRAASGFSY